MKKFAALVSPIVMACQQQPFRNRLSRDPLYSFGVFDLDAAPVALTLPGPGRRAWPQARPSLSMETVVARAR